MPRRDGPVGRMELLPLEARLALGDGFQRHWYDLAAGYVRDLEVLDVGAGTGYGLPILLAGGARRVLGIDPLPAGPGVERVLVEDVPDGSFDVVMAFDVIEHVEDDAGFLRHLLRVARLEVWLSTPNWDRFRCANPFHFREYTAAELAELLGDLRYETWECGDLPATTPPVRVVGLGPEASGFGVRILKRKESP